MNALFLDALQCKNRSRPPIWIMRQAGRYLPQYRDIREKYSFMEMCHQPELVAEITQLPLRLLGFDAAILFSDILMVVEALGLGLRFEDKIGPIIERPLSDAKDVAALTTHSILNKLQFVTQAIKLLKPALKVPLIGFCGAPFTVASYMIEGGSSKDLRKTKQWMLREPQSFHALLKKITKHTIDYLQSQENAGVDAIQIFDTWASYLAFPQFREFSLAYLKEIKEQIKLPIILFCKGSAAFAPELATLNPAGISIDWNADMRQLRQTIPAHIALQGNLDPDILYSPPAKIKQEAERLLLNMKDQPGYIFNLGHGILPDISVDAVRHLVDTVQSR